MKYERLRKNGITRFVLTIRTIRSKITIALANSCWKRFLINKSIILIWYSSDDGHTPKTKGWLRALFDPMAGHDFSNALFDMLAEANDDVRSSSNDYENILRAAFGRLFCIADIGVSTELSILPSTDGSLLAGEAEFRSTEPVLLGYQLPVTISNHTADFDGLVGTFPQAARLGISNRATESRYMRMMKHIYLSRFGHIFSTTIQLT